jgi:hypothetical protein
MEKAHRFVGDERRLLGGFRDDGVAGGKGCAYLTGEDRQRKFHGEIATIGPSAAAVETLRSVRTWAA